jgi:hypothetical protein
MDEGHQQLQQCVLLRSGISFEAVLERESVTDVAKGCHNLYAHDECSHRSSALSVTYL